MEKLSLKQAMMAAATKAGGEEGLVAYLEKQALATPSSFLTLLGKLAAQQDGDIEQPVMRIELVAPLASLDRQENNEDV